MNGIARGAVGVVLAGLLAAPGCARPPLLRTSSDAAAALNPSRPSLFIAGNSTAARGAGDRQQGWGVPFAAYFDTSRVNVVNRARGGRSSRTFITEGLWDRLVADVKPGDFVMMEFGHNDASPVNDTLRARGVLPGIGGDSVVIDNLITKQKGEVVYSFGAYLRKFVRETRARGATPIINSLTPRKFWSNGRITRNRNSFADWAEETAREEHVPFVNLTEIASAEMDTMPPARVDSLFGDANLHSSARGAEVNARAVVDGLRALGAEDPLRDYLRP